MKYLSILFVFACVMFACSPKSASNDKAVQAKPAETKTEKKMTTIPVEEKSAAPAEPKAQKLIDLQMVRLSDLESVVNKNKRLTIVDVYTDWCGPCKMMEAKTFTDASFQEFVNKHFNMVKFNAEGPYEIDFKGKKWNNPNYVPNRRGRNAQHQLGSFFAVRGYPTLVILDQNMNIKSKIVGYKNPEQLISALKALI